MNFGNRNAALNTKTPYSFNCSTDLVVKSPWRLIDQINKSNKSPS